MRWVFLIGFLLSASCSREKVLSYLEPPSKTARSTDNRVEITLPRGWQVAELPNAVGSLQARSLVKNAFVSLISEPKADLSYKTVDEYATAILDIEGKKNIKDRTISPARRLTLGGREAVQYEVRGAYNNINIVYLKTFVETDSRWTQVMAWTTPSHWDEVQDDFRTLYQTFHELPPPPKK